jgi:tRNA(Ile2) C34 agmatinyltransferase TiaS
MQNCNLCDGDLALLGSLGSTNHYRCVNCGMQFSEKPLRDYVCFFRQKRIELQAESSYAAQLAAAKVFKVKGLRCTSIAVVLADVPVDPAGL